MYFLIRAASTISTTRTPVGPDRDGSGPIIAGHDEDGTVLRQHLVAAYIEALELPCAGRSFAFFYMPEMRASEQGHSFQSLEVTQVRRKVQTCTSVELSQ